MQIGILILVCLTITFIIYGRFIEVNKLIVKNIEISNEVGIKVLHFSDLHFGKFYGVKRLKKLVSFINKLNPDLIIFTGDLLNGPYKGSLAGLAEVLMTLSPDIAKIAIYGNHDYKSNYYSELAAIYKQANFTLLINDSIKLQFGEKVLNIVGADDYLRGNRALDALVAMASQDEYNLLLLHEPDLVDKLKDNDFNLILSGHTHGGQINLAFNISGSTKYGKIYKEGLYVLNDACKLYVSSGVGNTGLNFRFRAIPSVSILNI